MMEEMGLNQLTLETIIGGFCTREIACNRSIKVEGMLFMRMDDEYMTLMVSKQINHGNQKVSQRLTKNKLQDVIGGLCMDGVSTRYTCIHVQGTIRIIVDETEHICLEVNSEVSHDSENGNSDKTVHAISSSTETVSPQASGQGFTRSFPSSSGDFNSSRSTPNANSRFRENTAIPANSRSANVPISHKIKETSPKPLRQRQQKNLRQKVAAINRVNLYKKSPTVKKSMTEIARELNTPASTLCAWVQQERKIKKAYKEQEASRPRNFSCERCGKRYLKARFLKVHQESCHLQQEDGEQVRDNEADDTTQMDTQMDAQMDTQMDADAFEPPAAGSHRAEGATPEQSERANDNQNATRPAEASSSASSAHAVDNHTPTVASILKTWHLESINFAAATTSIPPAHSHCTNSHHEKSVRFAAATTSIPPAHSHHTNFHHEKSARFAATSTSIPPAHSHHTHSDHEKGVRSAHSYHHEKATKPAEASSSTPPAHAYHHENVSKPSATSSSIPSHGHHHEKAAKPAAVSSSTSSANVSVSGASSHASPLRTCPKCGQVFANPASLESHKLVHKSEGRTKCRYCFKEFTKKSDLVHHEYKHTGERPYKCVFCTHAFIQMDHWKEHMRSEHPDRKPY